MSYAKNKYKDDTLKFLHDEELLIQDKLLSLQDDLSHIQSLIKKRKITLSRSSFQTRDSSAKAKMWPVIYNALETQKKEYEGKEEKNPGLSNKSLYEFLTLADLKINETTFRGYLRQFKNEDKIEKKRGGQSWTLVDNQD